MAAISFPALVPSQRSYDPGSFPEVKFEAQNGAVIRMRYGNQRANSKLSLTFDNISDYNASLVLANYQQTMEADNWVVFTSSNVAAGVDSELVPWITETNSALRWKYASPPSVSSVKLGLSTVSCEFVGELMGA
jgi:hypothetical protein